MTEAPAELPFLSSIGLMITYQCTVACPHCVVEAGPHRKEEMPLQQALDWIGQARAYRDGFIQGLAITGGEPFYRVDKLAEIADYARQKNFLVSVVTNTFWASSREAALATVQRLPAIEVYSLSTDVYHQRVIPFQNIQNAVWALKELGRTYNIAVCTDREDEPQFLKIIADIQEMGEGDKIRPSITFPVGRAQKWAKHLQYSTSPEPTVSACSMASYPVIFPDGKVTGCIGPLITVPAPHPLYLGNLYQEPLAHILDRAEHNLILHAVRVWGPHKLAALLKEHGQADLLPTEYIANCICDTCYKLLTNPRIVAALEEIVDSADFRRRIGYARAYYLRETNLIGEIE